MDICARSLSFWTYQVCQEVVYKDMVIKEADNQRQSLEQKLNQSNGEVKTLKQRMSGTYSEREGNEDVAKELEQEKQKAIEASEQCQERGRQIKKLQVNYSRFNARGNL